MATLIEDLKTFTPKNDEEAATTHYFSKPLIAKRPTIGHGRRTLPHQPGS